MSLQLEILDSRAANAPSGSRPSALPSRPSRHGVLPAVSTALFAIALLTFPVAAWELQISFSPNAPTWRDAVVIRSPSARSPS